MAKFTNPPAVLTILVLLLIFVVPVGASYIITTALLTNWTFKLALVSFGVVCLYRFVTRNVDELYYEDSIARIEPVSWENHCSTRMDFKIHVCDDVRCNYMEKVYGFVRDNNSTTGFCEDSTLFLSNPSGYYRVRNEPLYQMGFTYSQVFQGFPCFSPEGRVLIQPVGLRATFVKQDQAALYYFLHRYVRELIPEDYEPYLDYCMTRIMGWGLSVERQYIDYQIVKNFGENKFEGNVSDWIIKDVSRSFRKTGTFMKNRFMLSNLEVYFWLRQAQGFKYLSFGKADWKDKFIMFDVEDAENFNTIVVNADKYAGAQLPDSKIPKNESDTKGIGSVVKSDGCKRPQTEEVPLLSNDTIVHGDGYWLDRSTNNLDPKAIALDTPLITKGFESLPVKLSDGRVDPLLTTVSIPETTTGLRKLKEYECYKVKDETAVIHGLVFGSPGSVPANSALAQDQTIFTRLGTAVIEPTQTLPYCIGEFGSPHQLVDKWFAVDEWANLFVLHGDYYEPKCEELYKLFENDFWLQDKLPSMTKRQKARVLKAYRNIYDEGTFNWQKDKITYFIKGDELLMKNKGRVITFIPTPAWIRVVLFLDEFLKTFKCYPDGELKPQKEWYKRYSVDVCGQEKYIDIYWASGMTQLGLSEAATQAQRRYTEEGIFFSFVCGDDNTNPIMAMDATSYDTTQQRFFFEIQLETFRSTFYHHANSWRMVTETFRELFEMHKGQRRTNFALWDKPEYTLPSGGPHTLCFNGLGMIETSKAWFLQHCLGFTPEECMENAAKMFGLKLTGVLNPQIHLLPLAGAEFLKGIFVPYINEVGEQLMIWVPEDGRICKVGKMITTASNLDKIKPFMIQQRITDVANGYKSFYCGPILEAFKHTWSNGKEGRKEMWAMVQQNEEPIEHVSREHFCRATWEFWTILYEIRYSINAQELQAMMDAIVANGRSFAAFESEQWRKLVSITYRGEAYRND